MIIIGEKINGAIPSIKQAIAEKNEALIIERTLAQAKADKVFAQQRAKAEKAQARAAEVAERERDALPHAPCVPDVVGCGWLRCRPG